MMKRVWSTPSVVQCDLIQTTLEGHGIRSEARNELSAQFTGVGYPVPSGQALAFAWPEIWVEEADYEQALALITGMMKQPPEGEAD
ncbi:MAG: hypothetical protein BWK77_05205 [Verrucomicrobia bacterium A1]|nr:MAG: hypothetical protein BWK77_05205 [Verrucomicrobia bacterium A1]